MSQLLLVEGKNDLMVFTNIFKKHKVKESFKIEDKNGFTEIFKSLPIYFKTDTKTIGVVLDADSSLQNKWQRLKDLLTSQGYNPDNLGLNGTILTADHLPKFGVWIMPNNQKNGMLEDFVKHLVPKDDKVMPFVEEKIDELEVKKLNKYKSIHKSKARIHTWLAWQEDPGIPMGLAINKTYLDPNAELSQHFVNWIDNLFN